MGDAAPGRILKDAKLEQKEIWTEGGRARGLLTQGIGSGKAGVAMTPLKSRLHEGLQAGLLSQLLQHVDSCRLCLLHSVASDGGSQ